MWTLLVTQSYSLHKIIWVLTPYASFTFTLSRVSTSTLTSIYIKGVFSKEGYLKYHLREIEDIHNNLVVESKSLPLHAIDELILDEILVHKHMGTVPSIILVK